MNILQRLLRRRLRTMLVAVLCGSLAAGGSGAGAAGISEDGTADRVENSNGRIAVIIDDFGNNMRGTKEMLRLPIKFTVAVMPFLPSTKRDARLAHALGHDVLLHLPMEPKQGKPEWLGPGAVLSSMDDAEIRRRVEEALDDVPYAIGMNNHMGSKITGDERIMRIVLDVCQERGLFFVDSRTDSRSVAGRLAQELGLPKVENHVFLDDIHRSDHVRRQMKAAGKRADEAQFCVTIGHVGIQGKETAAGIRGGVAELKDRFEFVGISDLVREVWHYEPMLKIP